MPSGCCSNGSTILIARVRSSLPRRNSLSESPPGWFQPCESALDGWKKPKKGERKAKHNSGLPQLTLDFWRFFKWQRKFDSFFLLCWQCHFCHAPQEKLNPPGYQWMSPAKKSS